MRVRRLLTALTAVVAVVTGAPDDDDHDDRGEGDRDVPSWATRAVVAGRHVDVDLAEGATGTDLALYVVGADRASTLDFHTLSGARLRVARTAGADQPGLGAAAAAWLAYAADDGSADATLGRDGRLAFDDGS